MKHKTPATWIVTSLLAGLIQPITSYASNDSVDPFGAINRGAAAVEQSMQAGQQAIEAGTATATEITNQTNAAITSGTTAASGVASMAETASGQPVAAQGRRHDCHGRWRPQYTCRFSR